MAPGLGRDPRYIRESLPEWSATAATYYALPLQAGFSDCTHVLS